MSVSEGEERKRQYTRLCLLRQQPKWKSGLEEAHEVYDLVEQDIERRLQCVDVTIHVEPCTDERKCCAVICTSRKYKQRR